MKLIGDLRFVLAVAALAAARTCAAANPPGGDRPERDAQTDRRSVSDRLGKDAFLNAVGAVWAGSVEKSGAGYDASTGVRAATGFLISPCHVLTNMHVVYSDPVVINPALGGGAAFGVGQTAAERDRGALQGLKTLRQGAIIAHGGTMILDGWVRTPADDWALIRLSGNVDGDIVPMTLRSVNPDELQPTTRLESAGFPSDRRVRRGDGFKLKDLWASDGTVVAAVPVDPDGAVLLSTIQATPGTSGGPVYGDFDGRRHVVIGMIQSVRGNGLDATPTAPNVQVLFTPGTMAKIAAAQSEHPCP